MSFMKSKSEKWKRVEFSDLRDGNFASYSSGFLLPSSWRTQAVSLYPCAAHSVICEELPPLLTCELSFVPLVVHGVVCGNISKINLEDFSSPYLFQILLWNRFGASNTACNTSNTSNTLKLYLSSLFVHWIYTQAIWLLFSSDAALGFPQNEWEKAQRKTRASFCHIFRLLFFRMFCLVHQRPTPHKCSAANNVCVVTQTHTSTLYLLRKLHVLTI